MAGSYTRSRWKQNSVAFPRNLKPMIGAVAA